MVGYLLNDLGITYISSDRAIIIWCVFVLQVNTNGVVSFGSALSTYPSESLPVTGTAFVAPFWADIDTSTNGSVYYR